MKYQGKIQDPKDLVTKEYVDDGLILKENISNKKDVVNDSSDEYISGKALMQYIASGNGGYSKNAGAFDFKSGVMLDSGLWHSNSWKNAPLPYGDVLSIKHSSNNKYGGYIFFTQSSTVNEMYFATLRNGSLIGWEKLTSLNDITTLLSSKIDTVPTATENNIAIFTDDGNIQDSETKPLYLGTGTGASAPFNADTLDNHPASYFENKSDLLWENDSPESSLESVTISGINSYDYLFIAYRFSGSESSIECTQILNTNIKHHHRMGYARAYYSQSQSVALCREMQINDDSITIGRCVRNNSTNNYNMIPITVYGIKLGGN